MYFDLTSNGVKEASFPKVCVIAMLVFFESLLGGIIVILQQNRMPNLVEFVLLLCVGLLVLVTYLLTFLRIGEAKEVKAQ